MSLRETVVSFRTPENVSLFLEHNSVSIWSPGINVRKALAISSALAGRIFLQMSREWSVK